MRKAPGGKSGRRIEETSGEYEEKIRTPPTMEKERWMVGGWSARETAQGKRGADRRRNKRGPNVVVTGDVALPDDISPRNYLSVQRDSARRLPVLMLADNVPIVS